MLDALLTCVLTLSRIIVFFVIKQRLILSRLIRRENVDRYMSDTGFYTEFIQLKSDLCMSEYVLCMSDNIFSV